VFDIRAGFLTTAMFSPQLNEQERQGNDDDDDYYYYCHHHQQQHPLLKL
jgi:hypothetical protein